MAKIRLYCLGVDTGKGWVELRLKANSDTPVKGVVAGEWYRVPAKRDSDWKVEAKKTYIVEADEAWVDRRAAFEKYHYIRLTGDVTLAEYRKSE